jgi:NAD(P)-dependent dehydrogenase (short-subunit alcohol dehydrogenase family)
VNGTDASPVVVVTGAAKGIGRAIATLLAEHGWRLLLNDLSTAVHDLAADLAHEPGLCSAVCGDLAAPEVRDRLFRELTDSFGRVDALVNNAGAAGPDKDVFEIELPEFRSVLETNLVVPFDLARRAAAMMVSAGQGGRIVNIGSVFGQQAVPNGSAYCASKGGLALLTQALAVELGSHRITVNTVAPGYILTDMHRAEIASRATRSGRLAEQEQEELASSVPLDRHGTPEDVAGAVLWLLSDHAAYVTGQTVAVNGGILLS